MKRLCEFIRNERGNVESAMVLVPLLILFLIGLELATAVHFRNTERIAAQNEATTRAISGDFLDEDQFIHIDSSGDGQNLDLLITQHQRAITDVIPGFLRGITSDRSVDLKGLAIVENQR